MIFIHINKISQGACEIFRTRPDRPWGSIQPPVTWAQGVFPGGIEAGAWR